MSIYRFSDASVISDVTFNHANDRPPVALLTAKPGASFERLSEIRTILGKFWQCVPVSDDTGEKLQVSGFKNETELNDFLALHKFTLGTPQIAAEESDNPQLGVKDFIRRTSLKIAGWLNLIGDFALLISGVKGKRKYEVAAGGLYTMGGAVLARYGNSKTERNIKKVNEATAEFIQQQTGALSEDTGLATILKNKDNGVLAKAEDFLYRYPSQTTLGLYTAGAFSMLTSGIKKGLNKEGWSGAAYGANSVLLKGASLVIPEKSTTGNNADLAKKFGPFRKIIGWIQEKPLRLFGYGSMISEIFLGMDAYQEYKNNPKQNSFIFKAITTITYVLADLMVAISSKKNTTADGKFDKDEQLRIEALAAEAIVKQRPEQKEELANQVSGYLATKAEMNGNSSDIAKSILKQVKKFNDNPWANRVSAELVPITIQANR